MTTSDDGLGPDFICIGAQKGGTQWLYDQLAHHPDFWMPPIKELHYFDRVTPKKRLRMSESMKKRDIDDLNRNRALENEPPIDRRGVNFIHKYSKLITQGKLDLDGYAHLFDEKGEDITGDITGGYSLIKPRKVKIITSFFPRLKVIFIARDPVERIWSQLSMIARSDLLPQPVTPSFIVEQLSQDYSFAGRSYPSEIVRRWRQFVPDGQFGLFFFDDLRNRPDSVRSDVITFLGGDPSAGAGQMMPGYNRKDGQQKLVMTDEIRAALVRHFADELRKCADELGGPAADWPGKYGL